MTDEEIDIFNRTLFKRHKNRKLFFGGIKKTFEKVGKSIVRAFKKKPKLSYNNKGSINI